MVGYNYIKHNPFPPPYPMTIRVNPRGTGQGLIFLYRERLGGMSYRYRVDSIKGTPGAWGDTLGEWW